MVKKMKEVNELQTDVYELTKKYALAKRTHNKDLEAFTQADIKHRALDKSTKMQYQALCKAKAKTRSNTVSVVENMIEREFNVEDNTMMKEAAESQTFHW